MDYASLVVGRRLRDTTIPSIKSINSDGLVWMDQKVVHQIRRINDKEE